MSTKNGGSGGLIINVASAAGKPCKNVNSIYTDALYLEHEEIEIHLSYGEFE